jgi:redox-sensitive bicupin YhaK (pirin superfamily)
MLSIRRSADRGHLNHGWLDTYHTFSFGDYYDPAWMGYRSLRVINEDRVAPGQGFGMHGHRDMEIVTLVLSGALEHKDSLGHGEQLRPGELQYMSAGSGIRHSEFNPSATEPVHLYQIWIEPEQRGLPPAYAQRAFPREGRRDRWQEVVARDGREGTLPIRQDGRLLLADLAAGRELPLALAAGRHAWLQVLSGAVRIGDERLTAGDAAYGPAEETRIIADQESQLLLFDLA